MLVMKWPRCDGDPVTNDSKDTPSKATQSREERLAAQLRANLRRRKAQARAMSGLAAESTGADAHSKAENEKD